MSDFAINIIQKQVIKINSVLSDPMLRNPEKNIPSKIGSLIIRLFMLKAIALMANLRSIIVDLVSLLGFLDESIMYIILKSRIGFMIKFILMVLIIKMFEFISQFLFGI